jgi:hypothetical protein
LSSMRVDPSLTSAVSVYAPLPFCAGRPLAGVVMSPYRPKTHGLSTADLTVFHKARVGHRHQKVSLCSTTVRWCVQRSDGIARLSRPHATRPARSSWKSGRRNAFVWLDAEQRPQSGAVLWAATGQTHRGGERCALARFSVAAGTADQRIKRN